MNYKVLVDMGLVAPSTVSGWRKAGEHPKWVDALAAAWNRNTELAQRVQELEVTVRTLTRML